MTNPQTASQAFAASAAAVRAARLFAAATVESWGVESAEIETVVGELAANAYTHARTPFTVSLNCADKRISVEVADRSAQKPVLTVGPPDSLRGRGLLMVDAISSAWGTRETQGGKIVWAEVDARATGSVGGR
jgi:anti-sigma regulatory factor (Ser/Thr protein kinase)